MTGITVITALGKKLKKENKKLKVEIQKLERGNAGID